jgi:hypothetical protein
VANDIGQIKSVKGSSVALSNQFGQGAHKPVVAGKDNPKDTKPSNPADGPVPMPK